MLSSFFFSLKFFIFIFKENLPEARMNIFFFKIFYPYFIRELNQGRKVYPINSISPKFFIIISKRKKSIPP